MVDAIQNVQLCYFCVTCHIVSLHSISHDHLSNCIEKQNPWNILSSFLIIFSTLYQACSGVFAQDIHVRKNLLSKFRASIIK